MAWGVLGSGANSMIRLAGVSGEPAPAIRDLVAVRQEWAAVIGLVTTA